MESIIVLITMHWQRPEILLEAYLILMIRKYLRMIDLRWKKKREKP